MITKNSRVRHKNSDIDSEKGVMFVREIKGEYAICGYNDFDKVHLIYTYPIKELIISKD